MVRSMTAYARSSKEIEGLEWVIEIHSINRKMLDVHLHLPKEFLCVDIDLRKWIAEKISRGMITFKMHLARGAAYYLNTPSFKNHLKKIKSSWVEIANELGYDAKTVDLSFLIAQTERNAPEELFEISKYKEILHELTEKAIEELVRMKEVEGKALSEDIEMRLFSIAEILKKIHGNAQTATDKFREKLKQRLEEYSQGLGLDEERVLREVMIYAEKVDITEEIIRMHSHLAQTLALIKSADKSVGKGLEFLVQEMQREVNTMASKSSDISITNWALTIKAELEKIKEQVQNIE